MSSAVPVETPPKGTLPSLTATRPSQSHLGLSWNAQWAEQHSLAIPCFSLYHKSCWLPGMPAVKQQLPFGAAQMFLSLGEYKVKNTRPLTRTWRCCVGSLSASLPQEIWCNCHFSPWNLPWNTKTLIVEQVEKDFFLSLTSNSVFYGKQKKLLKEMGDLGRLSQHQISVAQ